jgi:hypothetical protein
LVEKKGVVLLVKYVVDSVYKNYRDSLITYTACKVGLLKIAESKIVLVVVLMAI